MVWKKRIKTTTRDDIEKILGGNEKMKVFYEDILICEVLTNRSLTVDEALELIGFDEEKFKADNGFDDIDYNDFRLEY
ncbi:hypothetical protein DXF96_00075 [Heyndrickxia coagulans]|nr:hypothetical protein CYJ15_12585 [Heyndrickxia coagulans]QDI60070.1 hypothetical protein DXF96_00075 [Heyndrickxia coagulans]